MYEATFFLTNISPDTYFYCEPCVADIFNVDESDMGVGAVFVQGPDGCVSPC